MASQRPPGNDRYVTFPVQVPVLDKLSPSICLDIIISKPAMYLLLNQTLDTRTFMFLYVFICVRYPELSGLLNY